MHYFSWKQKWSFWQLGYFVGSFQIGVVGGWRYMYGVGAPVALVMGLGMWSLPPSPRWLLLRAVQGKGPLQDYKEKAVAALSRLRGRPAGDKVSERQIEDTLVPLKSANADEEPEGSFLEVFQGPSLKAFIIAGGLVLFQQVNLLICQKWHILFLLLSSSIWYLLEMGKGRGWLSNLAPGFWQITGQPSVLYYAGPILQVHDSFQHFYHFKFNQ